LHLIQNEGPIITPSKNNYLVVAGNPWKV